MEPDDYFSPLCQSDMRAYFQYSFTTYTPSEPSSSHGSAQEISASKPTREVARPEEALVYALKILGKTQLWSETLDKLVKLKHNEARAKELTNEIFEKEASMKMQQDAGTKPSIEDIDALSSLYRENVRIVEESKTLLAPDDLLTNVPLLRALVLHSEETTANSLSASRDSRPNADFDGPSSPAPSSAENKQVRKAVTNRTASQPPRDRDAAKDELEEKESHSSRTKVTFALGAEVAFKPKISGQTEEHDWIQGVVVKIIGEGKSRRYDVQDPFPDDASKPGEIYRSSASSMVKIPPVGTPLTDYAIGKRVLALYPETTTFYRADVRAMLSDGAKVQLLFEEENAGALKVVDRRFVLDHKG